MLTFTAKVLYVTDETRDLPVKDKNGVPTQLTKRYRFTTIQAMVKDPDTKIDRPVVFKSVDLPGSFSVPKAGDTFVSPEVRKYELENGVPIISF